MREEILDYWAHSGAREGLEEDGVFREVEPRFGRLLVFDPRVPHGVRRVEGVRDVAKGRLVVHGWFVNPRPFIEGPLPTQELADRIQDWTGGLEEIFASIGGVDGVLSLTFRVATDGSVGGIKALTNSLRSTMHEPHAAKALGQALAREIARAKFSRRSSASQVTIPFLFSAGAES